MRLWASKHGGATFTIGVNALSVIQGIKKLTLDILGVPLSEDETGLVQKKWSKSRIAVVVRLGLIHNHYVNCQNTLGLDKSGPRREVVRLLR